MVARAVAVFALTACACATLPQQRTKSRSERPTVMVAPPPPSGSAAVAVAPRGSPMQLEALTIRPPPRYLSTHGSFRRHVAAPWVEDMATAIDLDLNALAVALGLVPSSPDPTEAILMSPAHTTGEWTYVMSDTTRIHQLVPVEELGGARSWIAVLASRPATAATRRDGLPATWVLALHASSGAPARVELDLDNTHDEEGLRDGISTTLEVANGRLRTSIAYTHTGSGDDCEQRASFVVLATATPELAIEHAERSWQPCF